MGLIGNKLLNEGGALPTISFYMKIPLLYFSLVCNGRTFSSLKLSFQGTIVLEGLILMLAYADCGVVLECSC